MPSGRPVLGLRLAALLAHRGGMPPLANLELQRRHAREHARLLRGVTAILRRCPYRGTPAEMGAIEALADERDRVADLVDACAESDNPLEGAAALCEMQALQRTPGTPLESAWLGAAEVMRRQIRDLNVPPPRVWLSAPTA